MADVTVSGVPQLQARLRAVSSGDAQLARMKLAAAATRGALVNGTLRVGARKTGVTAASIQIGSVTAQRAEIMGDKVAVWIDTGTGIYGPRHSRIYPVSKRALSWFSGSFGPKGSLRLSGRPRKGRPGAGAARVTVRSTRGMRARPYIARAVGEASRIAGPQIAIQIVEEWNSGG